MRIAHTAALFLLVAVACQRAPNPTDSPGSSTASNPGRAWIDAALRAPSTSEAKAMELLSKYVCKAERSTALYRLALLPSRD